LFTKLERKKPKKKERKGGTLERWRYTRTNNFLFECGMSFISFGRKVGRAEEVPTRRRGVRHPGQGIRYSRRISPLPNEVGKLI